MPILLGVDFGTEGVRVGALRADGRELATGEASYVTSWPRPGWAEQDPLDWWDALRDAVGQILQDIDGSDVCGLGLATTSSTVVTLDDEGRPLREAILWMDSRASQEAQETASVDHPVLRFSGGSAAVEWTVPKAMWLARHEPEVYARAAHIVEAIDYLNWRLTGEWVASRLNATCKMHYDPRDGGFPAELYAAFGVPDLPEKWPTRVLPVGSPLGTLLPSVAEELGLPGGVVVAEGGIDAHMGMLGMNVVHPGDVAMIAGTSVVHLTQAEDPVWHPGIWGPYPDALLDGLWLVEGGQVSAGAILRWLTRMVGAEDADAHERLTHQAAEVPPGSSGLLVLDFWQGNRTPYRDARLRGAVLGLSLAHGAPEIYRACVEALSYGTANVLASFEEAGMEVGALTLAGGIRHNPLWLQTTADVLQRSVHLTGAENATLRAGAVAVAVAVGESADLRSAAQHFAVEGTTIEPREQVAVAYQEGFARYRRAVDATRDSLHDLADEARGAT